MRILSHYYVARYLGLFLTVLLAAFLMLATIELVLNLDDISAFGSFNTSSPSLNAPSDAGSVGHVMRYLWLRIASYYLADLIPIASFLAVFITFAWAGRSMEILVIQAGGIRLYRVVLPVLATALILSLATALLHETVILEAQRLWASETTGNPDQPDFGRKAFWYHKGRTITNIAFADQETRILHGVEIFERNEHGTIIRVVRADRVQIGIDGVWHLQNADIWNFDPLDLTAVPSLDEKISLALNLDSLGGDVLLNADPGALPIATLAEYLDANRSEASLSHRKLKGRFHERLTSPWLVLAFGYLALPFALRVDERGHLGGPATAALAALSCFFLFQSAGATLARQEFLPPELPPWLALSIVFVGSALVLRRHRL